MGRLIEPSECQRPRFRSKLIALGTLDKDHYPSVIADRSMRREARSNQFKRRPEEIWAVSVHGRV